MKHLLLFCLLLASVRGYAQALPVDSASGKVVYRGTVSIPGKSADQIFARAKSYAQVATQSPLVEPANYVISGPSEKQLAGRVLRYELYIKAINGGYRYELSDFQNKTMPVQYHNAVGALVSVPGGQAPIERVLANPDGYKKGKPTPALLTYQKAVIAAAEQAVADLKQAMK
jgi:hypothetical protein